MATFQFKNSRIVGMASAFPRQALSTTVLAESLAVDPRRVTAMTGIESRHVAPPHLCASDLCMESAERLLQHLKWQRESVGALIFVSQTPDYFLPATACVLQQRLGLSNNCAAFDVNLGCSGYVYGLSIASSFVELGIERVLLLVGDTSSRFVSEQDKSVAFLFGDSGTATAIERQVSKSTFVLGTDGHGAKNLIVAAGHCRQRPTQSTRIRSEKEGGSYRSEEELFMDGSEVMAFTLREVPSLFKSLLAESETECNQLDAVLLHQANQFLIDKLATKLGLKPEQVPTSVKMCGNTSCASIPVTLINSLAASSVSTNLKLGMLGFGVGWSWAGCIVDVSNLVIPPISYVD